MASAYRSAMRSGNEFDSDEEGSETSAASSSTVRAESSGEEGKTTKQTKSNGLSQLPSEIRNRILMLTSRGVSYRYRISQVCK
jgi:hypothetical protein